MQKKIVPNDIVKQKLRKFVPRKYQWPIIDAIEKENCKNVVCIWPRRCLSGDMHITMADGSWKFLRDIAPGDNVLSWNGTQFVADTVQRAWKTEEKKTAIIRSGTYLSIIASEDHVFASCSGKTIKWLPIKNTNKYRSLLQYAGIQIPLISSLEENELAEFWGYLLADWYTVGYQHPKFINKNFSILYRVSYLAEKYFNIKPIYRKKGNCYNIGLNNHTLSGGTFNNSIKELFRNEGLDVQKSRQRLPKCVWNWSHSSIISFLSAIISSDGSIYCHTYSFVAKDSSHTVTPSVDISISCGSSYNYAWDIYWLLRKIGIVPQKPYVDRGSNWKVKIAKSNAVKTLLSKRIYGKEILQQKALKQLHVIKKQTISMNGCYRSRFKIQYTAPQELYDIETTQHHNFIANGYLVHNSGKDMTAFNICIRQCLRKVCVVYYIFPTFSQARRVIWDSISNEGIRILDYIPAELISSKNDQQMKIKFINGSLLQLVGSDNIDGLLGTNPYGAVFSEYALQDPVAYTMLRPILAANDGWAIFASTPRGRANHLYELYQRALISKGWKTFLLTLDDTKHISKDRIEKEKLEMSEDMFLQEYYSSFDVGIQGSYYAKYIDRMRVDHRICSVAYESGFPVHTTWDLGVRDSTAIIFFQVIGSEIRIIDYYEQQKVGLDHYAKYLQSLPYVYGTHIAPHDISVTELGTGITRLEKARQLGIRFIIAPNIKIYDGIEAVRTLLQKVYIDEVRCASLIKALENYRQEWDSKNKVYRPIPSHDWSSHAADCIRYMAVSIGKIGKDSSPEELDKRYKEAMYGNSSIFPRPFQQPRY